MLIDGPGWRGGKLKARVVETGYKAGQVLGYYGELERRETPGGRHGRNAYIRQPGSRVELLEPVAGYPRGSEPEADVGFRFGIANAKILREWTAEDDERVARAAEEKRAREELLERLAGVGLVDGAGFRGGDLEIERGALEGWLSQVETWQSALSAVAYGDVDAAVVAKRALGVA